MKKFTAILSHNILNFMNNKTHIEILKKYRIILLSILIVVFSIKWFNSGVFFYTDTHIPLSIDSYFQRMISVWDFVSGRGDVRHLILLPYLIFIKIIYVCIANLTDDVQIKIQIIEAVIFLLNSFIIIIGMERLSYLLLRENKINPNIITEILIGILTIFYLFNIWSITSIWRPFWPYIFHYSFLPLLIYSFLKCCDDKSAKNIFLMLITTVFISIGYTIPLSIIFDIIILLCFSMTFKQNWSVIRTLLIFIIFIGIINFPAFLVIITFPSITLEHISSTISRVPISNLLKYNSPDILRGFGITGYPPFYSSKSMSWYTSIPFFSEPLYLTVYIVLLLFPIVSSKRVSHNLSIIILFMLYLFFITFLSNNNTPFPFNIITTNILSENIFQLFRSTYIRFGEYLVMLFVLINILSWGFLTIDKNKYKYGILILLFFFIGQFPLLVVSYNLQPWKNDNTNGPSIHTQIPEEYKSLLTEIESFSRTYTNIIIVPYPSSYSLMDWYQGPSFFSLGSYGKIVLDYNTRSSILSNLAENTTPKLYAPYIIVYSQDTIVKDTDAILKNSFERLLTLSDFNNRFNKTGINNNNTKKLFIYKNEDFLSPFLYLNNTKNINNKTDKILAIYQNEPVFISHIRSNYYSLSLTKDTFKNNSLLASFKIDINKFKSKEIYIYPLMISYLQKGANKTENLYIYLKFKSVNDNEVVVEFGNGKNWNYTKMKYITINPVSSEIIFNFYYDGNIYLGSTNSSSIIIDSKNISIFNNGLIDLLKNDTFAPTFEVQFRTANINVSDIFIKRWVFFQKKVPTTPEDIYLIDMTENITFIQIKDYKKINPTLYEVNIDSKNPFMLSFAESYDPLWYAQVTKINGASAKSEIIRSVPIGSVINGFRINETGNLKVKIEYEPQRWFYAGAAISLTTLLLSVLYLVYDWRSNRRKEKETTETDKKKQ